MAGIADSHRVIGDVLHHDAAAADDHIAADGHARHHLHACADPDIVPHRDRVGILKPGVAALEVDGVTSQVKKEEVQCAESAAVVDKTFDGSLPRFVAAFLNSKPISAAEAAEIRALLDAAQSKEG